MRNSKNWWKTPVLMGDENDYGQFDYLIEPLPEDTTHWSSFPCKCDTCNKKRRWNLVITTHFRTLDGYDSADYVECYHCVFKQFIYRKKKLAKQWFETKRVRFFGDTRIGKTISNFIHRKYYQLQARTGKAPKWLNRIAGFTLPF